MTSQTDRRLAWEPAFLASLKEGKSICAAARHAGIKSGSVYQQRKRNDRFRREWDEALTSRADGAVPPAEQRRQQWKRPFLEALVETSNVTAAARQADVPLATVYKLRREDPAFAAKWLAALHEGYDLLEMELVGYLRDPAPARKMDVTAALRLLAAHRDTVERRRALAEEDDEQAVRASIDAFLEGMRQRRLANEAILIEAEPGDVTE